MNDSRETMPVIDVGRYAGTPIDKLPNSYLRWMIGQDFPKEWLEVARAKLAKSDHNDTYLTLSRHAIDMYSKRFLSRWIASEGCNGEGDGLATFLVKQAELAWSHGTDVSKHRHQDDGTVKEWNGVRFVFNVNKNFADYKELITVMGTD